MSTQERALLAHYRAASPDQIRRGRSWYRAARREVDRISRETGYTRAQVAAVMAITSPDAQLSTNVRWTEAACRNGGRTAGRYPADQLPKIRAALESKRPGRYATGPKVGAFYRAIMGCPDHLVIDRWASFAAGGPRDKVPPAALRREIERAYRAVAARVGETVRDFQAVVWIVVRETTPRSNGQLVRYADIT